MHDLSTEVAGQSALSGTNRDMQHLHLGKQLLCTWEHGFSLTWWGTSGRL